MQAACPSQLRRWLGARALHREEGAQCFSASAKKRFDEVEPQAAPMGARRLAVRGDRGRYKAGASGKARARSKLSADGSGTVPDKIRNSRYH